MTIASATNSTDWEPRSAGVTRMPPTTSNARIDTCTDHDGT